MQFVLDSRKQFIVVFLVSVVGETPSTVIEWFSPKNESAWGALNDFWSGLDEIRYEPEIGIF